MALFDNFLNPPGGALPGTLRSFLGAPSPADRQREADQALAAQRATRQLELEAQNRANIRQEQAEALKPFLSRLGGPTAQQIGGLLTSGVGSAEQLGGQLGGALGAQLMPPQPLGQIDQATLGRIEQQTATSRAQEQLALANLQMLPFEQAFKMSQATREAMRFTQGTEGNLRAEFNRDPVVMKAASAWQAYSQLTQLATAGDAVAMQAAITAVAQVQEPGLAVRQDDRLAYSGQNPFVENMVNAYNRAVGGDVSAETFDRLINAANALMVPHLNMAAQVEQDYVGLSGRYGADERNVTTGLGFRPSDALAAIGQVVQFGEVTR